MVAGGSLISLASVLAEMGTGSSGGTITPRRDLPLAGSHLYNSGELLSFCSSVRAALFLPQSPFI
ncbi:hypothetical protein A2872_03960 [Candidatus Gottesmanbacteria bacterium RIFCSPHIGHO2_01_FULL_42_12]|uniref:Uncharacterized protein n=1 Tax=Candidatus Gottesmanbacteria bacterium RIFCSPHIGHO2_01_FULL_42_12 TaxID=1798377 RepID=A0A1F5Z3X5_9BACT|nr:MAG: hypothetical protein A2872_03960 [Candidatus Gottesmanbacteria bacterium RIFCSPHIGHO2_01_FULL_42_12]